jgi:hypothetical protein
MTKPTKPAKPKTITISTREGRVTEVALAAVYGPFGVHRATETEVVKGRIVRVKEWRVSCLATGYYVAKPATKAEAIALAKEAAEAVLADKWQEVATALVAGRTLTESERQAHEAIVRIVHSFAVTVTVFGSDTTSAGDPMPKGRSYVSNVTMPQLVLRFPRTAHALKAALETEGNGNSVAVGTNGGYAAEPLLLGLTRELARRGGRPEAVAS